MSRSPATEAQIEAEWEAKEAAWLVAKTKSVLTDTTIEVIGNRYMSRDPVPIKMHVRAIELNYGPCIHFNVKIDHVFKDARDWDDHPFRDAVKDGDKDERTNYKAGGIVELGDIVDDTPAVRAMITELVGAAQENLFTGTDCTHRARLIACIRMFWS